MNNKILLWIIGTKTIKEVTEVILKTWLLIIISHLLVYAIGYVLFQAYHYKITMQWFLLIWLMNCAVFYVLFEFMEYSIGRSLIKDEQ